MSGRAFGCRLLCVVVLLFPAVCGASTRTAYMFRWHDSVLLDVPVPDSPTGPVMPSVVVDVDWLPIDSMLDRDGRILTVNPLTDELVAISPATGEISVLSTLSIDTSTLDSGLFRGVDGSIMFYRGGNGGITEFFKVDPDSGLATLQGSTAWSFRAIELHDGAYYGGYGPTFWRIDPGTFDTVLIREFVAGYTSFDVWGLASSGGDLWCGLESAGIGGNLSTIRKIDVATGQTEQYLFLVDQMFARFCSLQMITRQPAPAIPSSQPLGLVVLVLLLAVTGVLVVRRAHQ